MSYHETLGLSRPEFEDLLDHVERRSYDGRDYRHLPDYHRSVERGTVLIADTVVRGFPKIPRTLVLSEGIPRHFDSEIAVEEKLDGYNTRIARIEGDILAFTRGGIICPFTTHKVRQFLDLEPFFDDRSESMLCGEMIGPENPYTVHEYPGVDSIAFRAFDIRERETGASLPVRERRDVCEDYDIPQVPYHGVFDPTEAVDEVPHIIRRLDDEGREGVVMKSIDVSKQLKYTTSTANQGDLSYAFSLPFDYGQEFMFRRIIREAFQAVEWEERDATATDRAHALGESVLLSMIDTVREIQSGSEVGERHTVRADPDVVDALFDHLRSLGLQLAIEDDRRENGARVVTFLKKTRATNDTTQAYLDGQIVRE